VLREKASAGTSHLTVWQGYQPLEFVDRHLRATGCVASQGINTHQQRVPVKGKRHARCPEPIRGGTSEFIAADNKLIFGLERSAVFDSLIPERPLDRVGAIVHHNVKNAPLGREQR
jgi:hypothetical protein